MSKTKTSKVAKPSKADVLTKTKDAGITKPSKDGKTKSKSIAKDVATKEEKKMKKSKKVKEPTPEPSSESESDESASSESESEAEAKPTKAVNGKAGDSSDESSSDSSEDEAPAPKKGDKKANGVAAKKDESSDESDSDSDEEGAPVAVLGKAPAVDEASSDDDSSDGSDDDVPAKTNGVAAKDDDASDSSDSSSDDDDDEEETPAVKTNKRKADDGDESTTKKAKTENNGNTNLFIGNLSWGMTEDWLREEFEVFGELSGTRIVTDRESGRSKGFGYIEFVNAEDAAKAYEAKKGTELDNRPINLDWASVRPDNKDKQEDRRKSYGDQLSEPSDTLFVGNISFEAGQEEISEAFAPYGTISSVRLPTDPNTGSAKGFGYVTFSSVDEAKAALEAMQGGYIGSRPVRLDYSQPRPPREDGGFGGRGGGGRGRGFGDRGRGGRGGRGGFGDRGRGGRGGGRGFGDRGGRGGRGGSTNRGGFGDFQGRKQTFD